ncbi:MAG: hypothetical protein ACREJ3_04380 [Polyangiaceae bacterium]
MALSHFYTPVQRTPLVRSRLEIDRPVASVAAIDWDEADRAVRGTIDQLVKDVSARDPEIIVTNGRTRGGAIDLYVFSSFRLPGSAERDPIVAGVMIQHGAEGRVSLTADVCADESGHVYSSEDPVRVEGPTSTEHLVRAAEALAARLVRRADDVAAAVRRTSEG